MKAVRDGVALLGLAAPAILLWAFWQTISAVVPVHYGLDGSPNRFAGKDSLWMLVGISLLLYLFLLAVSRFAYAFNLPRPVGDPFRPAIEAEAVEMIAWLRLELVWIFALLVWLGVRVARHQAAGMGPWAALLPLCAIGATVMIYIVRMSRLPAGLSRYVPGEVFTPVGSPEPT